MGAMQCPAAQGPLGGSIREAWEVRELPGEEDPLEIQASERPGKAPGSEGPVLTPEAVWPWSPGLRCGSLHLPGGTEPESAQMGGLPRPRCKRIMTPTECVPIWAPRPPSALQADPLASPSPGLGRTHRQDLVKHISSPGPCPA